MIDEIATPDSSRYWKSSTVVPGQEPEQYDKQPLREDAMRQWNSMGKTSEKPPLEFPLEVVREAQKRYVEIQQKLTQFNPFDLPANFAKLMKQFTLSDEQEVGRLAERIDIQIPGGMAEMTV